eukprot:5038213-Alexandrium_andersonii.AAC.1
MSASLVGSEMCIRDRVLGAGDVARNQGHGQVHDSQALGEDLCARCRAPPRPRELHPRVEVDGAVLLHGRRSIDR